jgi:16S rRNA (cytidine1402-2'-O)-methyltransferase
MGILYIVATPLGNLKDITLRALEILKEVDLIACEDTRQTLKLLNHYQISKTLVSYFQHSKLSKIEYIAGQLAQGKNIALVTDAGTPGISDPGNKLIEELFLICHSRESGNPGLGSRVKPGMTSNYDIKIVPIPGPCAAVAALSVSGFPTDKFIFMGFPPHKKGRDKYFKEISLAEHTVVFYESTHRILKALEQIKTLMPERQILVARELTKMFESIYRGDAEEILNKLNEDKNNQKGEFVIVIKEK